MICMRLCCIYVSTLSACADHGYGKSVLYEKIEMKVNDLIQSFIHRDKSHMISMLNALQQSCF